MNDKVKELLIKLKKLADHGVQGEKINAQRLLNELLYKHGLTENDLLSEEQIEFSIGCRSVLERKLLMQINYMVTGIGKGKKRKNNVYLTATLAEQLEIKAMFKFYKKAFNKDIEAFFSAFIHKNRIFPENAKEAEEPTAPVDKAKLLKMSLIMQGLEKHQYLKGIES